MPSGLILIKIRKQKQRHGSIQPLLTKHMAFLYSNSITHVLNLQYIFYKLPFMFFVKVLKGIWKYILSQNPHFTCKF